jgi:hypothetical protein
MADLDFEAGLQRLFDSPPALADHERFAREVDARLDRGWTVRQLLIGTLGLAAGMVAVGQTFFPNFIAQMGAASAESTKLVDRGLSDLSQWQTDLTALPMNGEVVWMAAALGVMALAFAITRAVEEF